MNRFLCNIVLISSLFLGSACRQETVEQPGCGCEGKPTASITDALARISEAGIVYPHLMLKDEAIAGNRYSKDFILCDRQKIAGLSASGDYDYRVSGHLRPDCMNTSLPHFWRLEITAIRNK